MCIFCACMYINMRHICVASKITLSQVTMKLVLLLTASSHKQEVIVVTLTDVVLARERDVIADSAPQTTAAQLA